MRQRSIIAIPARNEAERLEQCLAALASQHPAPPDGVVLLLNNCTDDSVGVARRAAPALPFRLHVRHVLLPPALASAGHARRRAMALAARLAGGLGMVATTDADSVAPPDWLAGMHAALAAGAEAVCGRAIIDPIDAAAIPPALHAADALECAYAALLDEIEALIDPDRADPWPRHDEESGASIGVTVAAFHRAGGVPPRSLGEDRAFIGALRRVDARIRHAPEVTVTVSGRLIGRAAGGMADTMRRRISAPDTNLDDRLEPATDAARRAALRRRVREAWASGIVPASLAAALGVSPAAARAIPGHRFAGAAWEAIELASPSLRRRRVPVADLPEQTRRAHAILAVLRGVVTAAAGAAGGPPPVDDGSIAAAA